MGSYSCPISWLYSIFIIALISLANFIYADVLTIANRCCPFAKRNCTRVTLFDSGENFTIRPVTPVFDVVNKSPSWYVYPCSVICFSFSIFGFIGGQFYT
jgi:hypothetical protein